MGRIKLRKLLAKHQDPAKVLDQLCETLKAPFGICDHKQKWLFVRNATPEALEALPRSPIELEEECLGWLAGDAQSAPLAQLVHHMVAEEARKKAMANEVLSAYREITLLYKLSSKLASSLKSQKVVEIALEEAGRLIGGQWGLALLLEEDAQQPRVVSNFGMQPSTTQEHEALAMRAWQSAKQTGKPEIVNDLDADARFDGVGEHSTHSLVWATLTSKQEVLGVLLLGHNSPAHEYAAADLSLLSTIASQVAPAIENARLYENLEKLVRERTQELSLAKELAEAASRAKSQFLANMSHELRTPLNALLGYAQILKREDDLSTRQSDGLDVIQRSGEHLLMLINDLLDLSKIEVGKVLLHEEEFSLPGLLQNLAELFRMRAREQELDFISRTDPNLPKIVRADARRLRQVLMNLLGNAIKFTDHGEIQFHVRSDADQVVFEVHDTGIGVSLEDQQEIFRTFRQLHQSGRSNEGAGLGLAISDKLVDLMGGKLQVRSEPAKGSTFWFSLPMPEVELRIETPQELGDIQGIEGGPWNVLVVEDNAENRAVLLNLLAPLGFSVTEAVNGKDAVEKASTHPPHLILMDLKMPVMDGYEAMKRIRQLPQLHSVIIIALSASVFESDRQQSIDAGADDFVPKPIRTKELLEKLGSHLPLKWRRAPNTPAKQGQTSTSTEEWTLPDEEHLRTLIEQAKRGHIKGIREKLREIEALSPHHAPFIERLQQLVKSFKMKQLKEFLQAQLTEVPTASNSRQPKGEG